MKSKDDITKQINRIHASFGEHRLYMRALAIAMKYNAQMSETEYNKRAHKLYMKCYSVMPHRVQLAKNLLNAMGAAKYPRSVYAGY